MRKEDIIRKIVKEKKDMASPPSFLKLEKVLNHMQ